MIVTVKVDFNMEIVRIANLTKLMVEILGQTTPKFRTEIKLKLLYIYFKRSMDGFYCENSLQYGDRKNSNTYQNLWWKS